MGFFDNIFPFRKKSGTNQSDDIPVTNAIINGKRYRVITTDELEGILHPSV